MKDESWKSKPCKQCGLVLTSAHAPMGEFCLCLADSWQFWCKCNRCGKIYADDNPEGQICRRCMTPILLKSSLLVAGITLGFFWIVAKCAGG